MGEHEFDQHHRGVQAPMAAGVARRAGAAVPAGTDRPDPTRIAARRFPTGDRMCPGVLACGPLGGGEATERWLAWSTSLWSHVVVELPREELVEDLGVVRRLRRAGRALRRLRHPSVPRLLQDAHDDPVPHLVLEHAWDATLDQVMAAEGPLHPVEVARLGLRLASCLHHVHELGLVQLAIEPRQIAIRDDHVLLLDFGAARPAGGSPPPCWPRGTEYDSPERRRRGRPDPRMDLFSLGAVLYELATGRRAFPAGVCAPRPGPPVRARALRPSLPRDLDAVIHALMEPDARGRPHTAWETLRLLAATLPGGSPAMPRFVHAPLCAG
jgi:serine/threonine-protein kinase